MIGSCAKQRVIATIVTPDGASFIGENECLDAQEICPREGMATGEGYHLCKDVCQQVGHAEIVALSKAGDRARGSSIYLKGHTYICDACKEACRAAGISEMFVCAPADPSPQTNGRVSGAGKITPEMIRDTAGWSQSEDDLRDTLRWAANELERALSVAPAPQDHSRGEE